MLTDPARTGVVAVARPEEMPVSEALDLERVLQAELGVVCYAAPGKRGKLRIVA